MWDNFANILSKLGEKSLVENWLLCLAACYTKLKVEKLLYSRENRLSATKITRPKKLQHYFSIIINIFLYDVIKTSKKPKILIFIGVHPGLKFAPH